MANFDTIAERQFIWEVGGQRASGLVNDRTLLRKVIKVDLVEIQELAEYLRLHTSVLNKGAGKCYTVKNPMVNGIVHPGTWRGVDVATVDSPITKGTITQQLSLGWATKIAWTEARLLESDNLQPLGAASYKFLTVQWVNCARGSVNAMAASLSAASFAAVIIQGEPYAGTWYNSGVTPSIAPDGSGIVTLELSIQYRDIPFQTSEVRADALIEVRQQLGLTTETQEPMTSVAGEAKSQQVSVNKDSSKNVHTSKDTGIEQTTEEIVDTGLVKSVVEEKTVQVTELPDPTPPTLASPGVIVSIINRVSKYFQRWTTRKKTDTAKHVSVNEYISHIGERGTTYQSEEKHDSSAPNIMKYRNSAGQVKTATLDAQGNPLDADEKSVELSILSHSLDDFLTRNYTKSRTVKKFPISDADNVEGLSWPVYGDMETVTIQTTSPFSGNAYVSDVYKYQIIDTYTMRYFTSAKAARVWIISKNTTSALPEDPLAYTWSGEKTKYDENNLSTFRGSGTEWTAIAVVRTRSERARYRYHDPYLSLT